MPPARRWVRVLAVVWAAAQCDTVQATQQTVQSGASPVQAAQQTVQSGAPPVQTADLSATLDVLWTVVDRAVKSAVEPLIGDLGARLTTVQSQINSQNAQLLIHLGSLQNELRSMKTELTDEVAGLNTRLNKIQVQLDSHGTRLDSESDNLAALLTGMQTQLGGNMDGMKTQLTAQNTELKHRLGGVQSDLAARITGLNTSLSAAETQLDSPISDPASCLHEVKTQLTAQSDSLVTRLNGLQTHLETKMDNVTTKLVSQNAELTVRLESDLTSLNSRLDSVQSELLPISDCSDLPAGAVSGIHNLRAGRNRSLVAYCDMETDGGGWTVIQRRADVQPRQNFSLGWNAYKNGFGELEAEFWWGLDSMWRTTSLTGRRYELRIDLEDFESEKRYAVYEAFRVSSEADGYRMTVAKYRGDAGDGLTFHSGWRFSTKDRDQDGRSTYSCADRYKGGWWYSKCHYANLNGLYLSGQTDKFAQGVTWMKWKGQKYSLMSVEMKIRPIIVV